MKTWWGATVGTMGWTLVFYDWLYIPLCVHVFHIEPWGPTANGIAFIVACIVLNTIQFSLDEHPKRIAHT